MALKQGGESVIATNEAVIDSDLAAVPAGSTNGVPLPGRPAGAQGVIFYLASGQTVTYTIAQEQPGSAPTATFSLSDTDRAWHEPLGPETEVYVTAKTGTPLYRWI